MSHLEGETVLIDDWQITIVDVEGRFIHLLELTLVAQAEVADR